MRHTHISAARSSKVRTRPANRAALALPVAWADRGASCIRSQDTKNGASTFDALDEMLRRNGWAFPAARGKGYYVSLPKVLDRLCKRAKLEGVMLHLLRHSFAATAAEMSFSELTIASLLGHTVPGVTARYAHVPDSALVAAADRVSARIAAALDGETGKGEVIPLKPARKAENHKDTPFPWGTRGTFARSCDCVRSCCSPRLRKPPTHTTYYAVVSQNPVQNPGQVKSSSPSCIFRE